VPGSRVLRSALSGAAAMSSGLLAGRSNSLAAGAGSLLQAQGVVGLQALLDHHFAICRYAVDQPVSVQPATYDSMSACETRNQSSTPSLMCYSADPGTLQQPYSHRYFTVPRAAHSTVACLCVAAQVQGPCAAAAGDAGAAFHVLCWGVQQHAAGPKSMAESWGELAGGLEGSTGRALLPVTASRGAGVWRASW
jgi:hypothetical protein